MQPRSVTSVKPMCQENRVLNFFSNYGPSTKSQFTQGCYLSFKAQRQINNTFLPLSFKVGSFRCYVEKPSRLTAGGKIAASFSSNTQQQGSFIKAIHTCHLLTLLKLQTSNIDSSHTDHKYKPNLRKVAEIQLHHHHGEHSGLHLS